MNKKEIDTLNLFPEINSQLIELLKSLTPDEWKKETAIPGRSVKDLASHILDGSLRRLSLQRDGYFATQPTINSYQDLVSFIQSQNKEWIEASQKLSPQILIALLEMSETWLYNFFKKLDPNKKAMFSVAWSEETESKNWFDIAREYTEKWHHQMQIRLAVNKPGINSRELLFPVIDTFMLGLPNAYKNIQISGSIKIEITGEAHGIWYLENQNNQLKLINELSLTPKTTIKLSDNIAWQLFTDSISKQEAEKHIAIFGNKELVQPFLNVKTVMR